MKRFDAVVVSTREVAPGMSLIWLAAPAGGASAKSGQFYMVRCGEHYDPLLRRPIAFHRARFANPPYGKTKDLLHGSDGDETLPGGRFPADLDPQDLPSPFVALALLVARSGRGTGWLASRRPGEKLDVLGPLGSGFRIAPEARNLLLVAGGMGIASLVALAEEAIERDLSVTLLQGVSKAGQAYPAHLLPPQVEVILTTEDGSAGKKGLVTDLLPDYLGWADQVFACGPKGLYVSMHSFFARFPTRKSVQVSVEERMACGFGVCLGCSVRTKHGMKTSCKDGPVFELAEVVL